MSGVLDAQFIRAMDDLFGEASVERFGDKNTERLRAIWDRARLVERKDVFEFLRAPTQESRCEDKEWLYQVSWVIGNGTYLTKPSLDAPLSWLIVDEAILIDDNIRHQLLVTRVQNDIGAWKVTIKDVYDPVVVAHIFEEENDEGSVTHRVELQAPGVAGAVTWVETRIYQTWEQCIHAIVAWVRVRK